VLQRILARRAGRNGGHAEALGVRWDEIGPIPYSLHLAIRGHDHPGLMNQLAEAVASLGLDVTASKAQANKDRSKALIALTVAVSSGTRREAVLRRLRAVPGITNVERDTGKGCTAARD
jgi:guanosine-3',5'-bis(diphosphate) 3'-pyrophosphohydrolase